jgi:recombinational DNA repair protein (RecF pathway)
MNQIREWLGKCQRCLKPSDTYTMSIYDVSLICVQCSTFENETPNNTKIKKSEKLHTQKNNVS